ncbi:protein of unknown function [Chitinophaga jiangningensis]|uniref:DUF1842 domain-containing protein n=1 Tax=Chitinophaga jiangningensis TaxID=1419482 RepID=A0A1M7AG84_9BACT|nr:DUF1842 domain-containing protein [Chitinophaga jiangningensis]SHL41803.1 protein of unknown function [Chitinophaga jiangningensis]
MNTNEQLFTANYRVGSNKPGAPSLKIALCVSTVTHSVSGQGHLFQAVNPPLFLQTFFKGNYFTSPILPPEEYPIIVNLSGSPFIPNPLSNVLAAPNMELTLTLTSDWQRGICTYKYQVDGEWKVVTNVPVAIIEAEELLPAN